MCLYVYIWAWCVCVCIFCSSKRLLFGRSSIRTCRNKLILGTPRVSTGEIPPKFSLLSLPGAIRARGSLPFMKPRGKRKGERIGQVFATFALGDRSWKFGRRIRNAIAWTWQAGYPRKKFLPASSSFFFLLLLVLLRLFLLLPRIQLSLLSFEIIKYSWVEIARGAI